MSADTQVHFSPRDERALAELLDELVPPSDHGGGLPGAGALGVIAQVEDLAGRIPGLGPMLAQGLSTLDRLASQRNADGFAALPKSDRRAVVDELTAADPGFFPTLTFVAYVGYYQHPRVVAALGLEHRPPHPKEW